MDYKNAAIFNMVYKTVFFIDPSAEFTLEISFQGFRFAFTSHYAISFDVFNENVDPFEGFLILCLPIQIIPLCVIRPVLFTHRQFRLTHLQCLYLHGVHEQISIRMLDFPH